jgi:hypothetical protein
VCLDASGQGHEAKAVPYKQGIHTMQSVETTSFPKTALLHEVSGGITRKEGTEGRYWYSCLPTSILGARRGSALRPGTFTPARDQVRNEEEARCTPGTVRMSPKYLASTGDRTPGCPARSESLHRLRHPGRLLRDPLHLK